MLLEGSMLDDSLANIVAIVGAHGAGKTTLIEKMKTVLLTERRAPVLFVGEVARHCPYKVGLDPDPRTQPWIMAAQDAVERFAAALGLTALLDRCLLDQYAYFSYWMGESRTWEAHIAATLSRYAAVFLLPGRAAFLRDDGKRPVDSKFQDAIAERLRDVLAQFQPAKLEDLDVLREGGTQQLESTIVGLSTAESRRTLRWQSIEDATDAAFDVSTLPDLIARIVTVVPPPGARTNLCPELADRIPERLVSWLDQNGLSPRDR